MKRNSYNQETHDRQAFSLIPLQPIAIPAGYFEGEDADADRNELSEFIPPGTFHGDDDDDEAMSRDIIPPGTFHVGA
ncbi:MAG: hypothetical protein KDA65_07955 [Planctomycetaceae bacterium]|nr:hypothetical protein [Planctomycetaceae bacterium]